MFGKTQYTEILAKMIKLVYVYDTDDNYKFLGSLGTVECTKIFHIGKETFSKCLSSFSDKIEGINKVDKEKLYSRTSLTEFK